MVVHYKGDETGDEVIKLLRKVNFTVRSIIFRDNDSEMTLQLKCKNDNLTFVENIRNLKDVSDVTLLNYDGEYHG